MIGNSCTVGAIGQGIDYRGTLDYGDVSIRKRLQRLIVTGLEHGMNFVDTAEIYGGGASEELIGSVTAQRRSKLFIATKFSPDRNSPAQVSDALHHSLKRLNTDYVDLYQVHWPSREFPVQEAVAAMEQLVDSGKVRFIGLSNVTPNELRLAEQSLKRNSVVSVQMEYSLFERSAECGIQKACEELNLVSIAYSPLARLANCTGEKLDQLSALSSQLSLSPHQLALGWLIQKPNLVAIPRTSSERHLLQNAMVGDVELADEDVHRLNEIFSYRVESIPVNEISVAGSGSASGDFYRTVEEALENRLNFSPSPSALAASLKETRELLKPVKVVQDTEDRDRYLLVEGQLRYWAWFLAFEGQVPIQAIVIQDNQKSSQN